MYPSHLGAGDRVDFVEPPTDGPLLGYSDQAVASLLKAMRDRRQQIEFSDGMNLYTVYFIPNRTDPSGLGSAVGFEGHFFGGGGTTTVQCKDKRGCPRVMQFIKACIGGALGGGATPMYVNMDGERCDPSFYTGWFYEAGVTVGVIGAGVDVGYTDGVPNGTVEGGVGIAPGAKVKSTWCYYWLWYDSNADM